MNPLVRVRRGQIAVGEHLISVQQHIPLTSTDRVISSAPSTSSTRPHYQSSHMVARVTGVGSRGALISGDGGVTVGHSSIGWYAKVGANH